MDHRPRPSFATLLFTPLSTLLSTLLALAALVVPASALGCPPGRGHHRGHEGDCQGNRVGDVRWEIRSSHPLMDWRGPGRVLVEVQVRADRLAAAKRRPIATAIVLDRSGSMRGSKWSDAAEAARAAIRRLEPGDIVSVVSYASDVRVDWPARRFERRDRDDLMRVIDRMQPTGSTYLEGGLRRAAEQLRDIKRGDRPTRILLVSDGNANVGVQSGDGLSRIARGYAADGIVTTTIGLGTDYNEDTMTAVADGGNGSYYYVRESERLAETFSTEIERMMATAARRVSVRVRPGAGVRVRRALGYVTEPFGDGGVEIPLGDLASGAERSVLLELELRCDRRGRQRLAGIELGFEDRDGEPRHDHADVDVDVVEDHRRVERERDQRVLGRYEEHKLAEEMKESAELVQRGKGEEARLRLQAASQRAREMAKRSGNKSLEQAADEAEERADAAPAASQQAAPAREHYKKSMKARAYHMAK